MRVRHRRVVPAIRIVAASYEDDLAESYRDQEMMLSDADDLTDDGRSRCSRYSDF